MERLKWNYAIVILFWKSSLILGLAGYSQSFGASPRNVYLVRTDSLGDTLWTNFYDIKEGPDFAMAVKQTSDSCFIVAGYEDTTVTPPYPNLLLMKIDQSGDTLWTKIYGDTLTDQAYSIQETSDGGFIVTGTTKSFATNGHFDVWLLKTNSFGDTLWTKTYGGTSGDFGEDVSLTNDGGYIIAGYTNSFGAGGRDIYLIKTDSLGNVIWERFYGDTLDDAAYSIHQILDGNYIVTGVVNAAPGVGDVWLLKIDSNGDTIWTQRYGGNNTDAGYSVLQTFDGGYILTGTTRSFGAGSMDMYLIKTTPDVGIQEKLSTKSISTNVTVYPNPFTNSLQIQGCPVVKIYDISGKFITEVKNHWSGKNLQGCNVPPGIYFLKFEGKNVGKVVKVR